MIYEALNIPPAMFTVIFAIPRTAGWIAQWLEMSKTWTRRSPPAPDLHRAREREYVAIAERSGGDT